MYRLREKLMFVEVKGFGRKKNAELGDFAYRVLSALEVTEGEVTIIGSKSVDGEMGGFCGTDTDYDDIIIEIAKEDFTDEELRCHLAHELVHAKQYIKQELSEDGRLWYGKEYNVPYYELPWEKEAYSKEKVLATTCA